MDKARREQIYKNLSQKSTQELLDIWQEQDLEGWEKGAFEIIRQILLERLGELPTPPLEAQVEQILNRVEKLLEAGNFDQALTECELAIQMMPENAVAYNLRGMVYEEMGQLEKAILEYQTTIQLDPDWEEAWDDLKEAEKALEKEFQRSSAKQHLDQALLYAEAGNFDQTLTECELAIQMMPENAFAYNLRGMVYKEMGQLEKAILEYQTTIQLDPDWSEAWDDLKDAEKALEKEFQRSSAKQHLDQALLYTEDDEMDDAMAECELARQTIPPIAMAYNYLGLILHQTNQIESAIEAYLKAISFNPKFYAARQNLRDARVKLKEDQFLSSIMKNGIEITPEQEIISIEDEDIWLLDEEEDNTYISDNEMDGDLHDEEEDTPP